MAAQKLAIWLTRNDRPSIKTQNRDTSSRAVSAVAVWRFKVHFLRQSRASFAIPVTLGARNLHHQFVRQRRLTIIVLITTRRLQIRTCWGDTNRDERS